ncbi:MAG: flavodoxin family protein [Chloroflexi bacterium]|nr:flavodoxin family protein [Chloroflexota bacterium]
MPNSLSLLCLLASPRRGGNSDILAAEACRAFEEAGGTAQKIILGSLNLHDCRGCDWCKTPHEVPYPCAQQDDMQRLYVAMTQADAILWATPIYYWSPAVSLKMVIDRLFCWGEWQPTRHAEALQGRPVGLVLAFADEDPASAGYIHAYSICKAAVESSGGVWAGCAWGVATDKGDIQKHPEALERARTLGAKLYTLAKAWRGG